MKTTRQLTIENRPGYFFNDMTNILDFDRSLFNINEASFRGDELILYDITYTIYMDNWPIAHRVLSKGKSATPLFYSLVQRCCLQHLIKQNYLLKNFLKTLILMT